jgi:hypothetical protein
VVGVEVVVVQVLRCELGQAGGVGGQRARRAGRAGRARPRARTRVAHDGHGAVAHGDHLRQAAGLEHGGHHYDVARRVDEVGQRLVVLEAEAGVLAAHLVGQLVKLGLDLQGVWWCVGRCGR